MMTMHRCFQYNCLYIRSRCRILSIKFSFRTEIFLIKIDCQQQLLVHHFLISIRFTFYELYFTKLVLFVFLFDAIQTNGIVRCQRTFKTSAGLLQFFLILPRPIEMYDPMLNEITNSILKITLNLFYFEPLKRINIHFIILSASRGVTQLNR